MLRSVGRIAVVVAFAALAGCGQPHTAPAHAQLRAGEHRVALPRLPAPAALVSGRFQIVAGSRDSSDTFLLDTMTGHVWKLEQKRGLAGQPYVWEHMDRLDTNADDYVFEQEHEEPGR